MVNRNKFEELLEACEEMPAIGIIGLRQIGKTTLAKQLLDYWPNEYIYLDLERPSDLNKIKDAELFLTSQNETCFILDEIQVKPEFFPLLRSLIDDDRKPGKFIILGSASPQLLNQSGESLAGKIRYLNLPPLQLSEINEVATQQEHWLKGGFPNSGLSKLPQSNRWGADFIQTVTERDLLQLGFPANAQFTYRFLTMLANLQGQLWNANNLGKSLDLNNKTKNFLENAFLIESLQPWRLNAKKRMVKSPKV